MIVQGTKRMGFEFKFTKSPKLTKSMPFAMNDLKWDQLTVIYPGDTRIRLSKDINCYGLEDFLKKLM